MLHDPTNKDGVYQSGIIDNDLDALRDEFEYHYEKRLDSFQDKIDDFSSIFNSEQVVHPDKMLTSYDKKTTKYLTSYVFPFFKEMEKYYGPKIMDVYQEYIDQIAEEREAFVKFDYEGRLQEHAEEQEYNKRCKELTKQILEILNKNSPMKQAALMNNFPKEKQKIVKDCLKNLIDDNHVFRVKKDINKNGPYFLVTGKHRYNWQTIKAEGTACPGSQP